MNLTPRLSLAGIWQPVDTHYLVADKNMGALASTTYGHLQLGHGSGMVVSGWGWTGGFGADGALATPEKVRVAMLAQQADGTLALATSTYLPSDLTNGANSVATADFNGDGKADIFLPAHNESPFQATPSTLYLSNASGGFDHTVLDDNVMAHDAQWFMLNGTPTVLTASYAPGDLNPVYQWKNGAMQQAIPTRLSDISAMSVVLGNFGKDGGLAIALGDVYSNVPGENFKIKVYGFADGDIVSTTPLATITPYLSQKYPDLVSHYGLGTTHTYRLLTDDFNHDGHADLIAEQSMWLPSNLFPSALQMLQNDGSGQFIDKTDAFGSVVREQVQELDYQPQLLDIDGSGIDSIVLAGVAPGYFADGNMVYDPARAPNYVLLNDGTGRLHTGLHEEFTDLGEQVRAFLEPLQQHADGSQNFFIKDSVESTGLPKFVGYQVADGSLNYVAELTVGYWAAPGVWGTKYVFVNVPVGYNPTVDFTDDVSVSDRNGSKLMRTWAGDDTFHDTNAAGSARIDGGLGFNTSVYSGARDDYLLARNADGSFSVSTTGGSGPALSDTLVNMTRLEFSNASVALDIDGVAGQAYRLYTAAFGREPDPDGLGYWIGSLDRGASLLSVADAFARSGEFQEIYGAAPTTAQLLHTLYEHVLHREPDPDGFDYWAGLLDAGTVDTAQVLAAFAESRENQAQVIGMVQDGIAYQPYLG